VIIAVLSFIFIWCLLYGRVGQPFLLLICAGLAVSLSFIGRHRHSGFISIDVLAQGAGYSRLREINPMLKFWMLLALIIICVALGNIYTGVFLIAAMFVLAVVVGKVRLHEYVQILALPILFVLFGGLALLFELSSGPVGVLNINVFGFWLSVSAETQFRTALVISRAFGAVSCLCFLSITTPMPDIIEVLRRARCPELIIDLMYLVYRYIFILLTMHHEMHAAAKSRLGFRDYRSGMRATGRIYSNLLARSYQFASRNFDAMESRCYDTGIRFLEHKSKVRPAHACLFAALLSASLYLSLSAW
jgi:cobalt/nickel transport system permease protein